MVKTYDFEAIIKKSEVGSGGAYVEFPYDVQEEFGVRGRVKVVCSFENVEYRGSLVKMGTDCHIIGITKDIRKSIQKDVGDKIKISIYQDTEARIVEIHPLLKAKMDEEVSLKDSYEKLSYTRKKEILSLLNSAKKEETLIKRLNTIILELKK